MYGEWDGGRLHRVAPPGHQRSASQHHQNPLLEELPRGGLRIASYGFSLDARRTRPRTPAVVHDEVVVLRPRGRLAVNHQAFDGRLGAAWLHLHVPGVGRGRHKGHAFSGAFDKLPLDVPPPVA